MKQNKKSIKTSVIRAVVAGVVLTAFGVLTVVAVKFIIRNKNRQDIWNTPYNFPGVATVTPYNFADYAGTGVGKLILPDEKPVSKNLVLDAPDYDRWAYQTYDIAVLETYREKLREAGYKILQTTDGSWAAHRNGVTVYARNVWAQARISFFARQGAPKSGCTPDQVMQILASKGHRVDCPEVRYDKGYSWEANTPDDAIDPIDITPSGMFEKTGAQLFVAFVADEQYGILDHYYVVRGGNAYEWDQHCLFVFGDATGDGKTELCMSGAICTNWEDSSSYQTYECFSVYPRTENGEKAVVYDLQASDHDMLLNWSMVHPLSDLDAYEEGVVVEGSNEKNYFLRVKSGWVRLVEEKTAKVVGDARK